MAVLGEAFQAGRVGGLPLREKSGGGLIEGGELRVAEDGGFDLADGHFELRVTGPAALLEKRGAHRRKNLPVAFEVINVVAGNAAAQVGVDVLQVFPLSAVDVAREVEVVVVLRVAD